MALKTKSFAAQIALVTGGGTGIGRIFADALAQHGARVVIASRRENVLHKTADELNAQCGAERAFAYKFDARDEKQCDALIGYILERFGALDVLINNSGLAVPETIDKISEAGWDKVLDTNVRGAMRLVRAALPHMVAQDFGDIVNISSQAGKHGYADVPSYCASKFALLGYAESLRDHVRKINANIRVFNFCPGLVDVDHEPPPDEPRAGAIHVRNMARTLMFALSLDRNVVVEDVSLYAK